MSSRDALVIAVFVLMLAGAIAFGAYLAITRPQPGPDRIASPDDDGDLDKHFRGLWWTRW